MAEANQPAGAPRRANSRFAAIMTVVLGRLKTLLPLAIATILMLLGFFLIWQCSLVYSESDSFEAAQAARKRAVSDIGAKIQQLNQQATEIVQSPVVLDALGSADPQGLAAAAEAVKAQWPEVVESTFYTAELPEVRGQDLKTFGYWRAQMLMQAQMGMAPAPAQVHGGPGNQQLLVLVQPVVSAGKPVAYASLSLPSRVIIDILGRVTQIGRAHV